MATFRKEAVVIIVDVGRSMGKMHGALSGVEKAKKALRQMIQQKLLFTKQDEMGVVLVGTADTENALNEEQGGYEHIKVVQQIQKPNLEMLEAVDSIESENAQGDVIDALLVAMAVLKARVKKLKFAKRIFLITDAAGAIGDDAGQIETIAGVMTEDDIKLNIIGVGFEDGEEADDDDDTKVKVEGKEAKPAAGASGSGSGAAKKEQKDVKEGGASASGSATAGVAAGPVRTATQKKNEKFLRDFAEKVNGAVFNVNNALEMLSFFRSKSVMQVTKYRGAFEISKHVAIQVYTYGKTAVANLPSLSKMSIPAHEADEASAGKVTMDRVYIDKANDRVIDKDQRTKSFKYGKQNVPFAEADLKLLKYTSTKTIKTLGFVPAKAIPRHHAMATVDVIVPAPGDDASARALSALIHALYELDHVGIVRYVARKDAVPKLGYVFPHISASAEFLYFNKLPYAEDIREYPFASLDSVRQFVPTAQQKAAARDLINSMNLMTAATNDDGKPMEALKPKYTFNPVLQRFYQCVEKRALDEGAKLDELDPLIAAYVNPDKAILSRAEDAFKKFAAAFPLKKADDEKKKEKRHWRDFFDAPAQLSDDMTAAKKLKLGDGSALDAADVKFDDITAKVVDKISTVSPVDDLRAMLARRDDAKVAGRALHEMVDVIKRLVKESVGDAFFGKAFECLQALRAGCVQMEEAKLFNDALNALHTAFAKTKDKFWGRVVAADLQPINSAEVSGSTYTRDAAAKYHAGAPAAASVSVSVSVPSNSDDLFAGME